MHRMLCAVVVAMFVASGAAWAQAPDDASLAKPPSGAAEVTAELPHAAPSVDGAQLHLPLLLSTKEFWGAASVALPLIGTVIAQLIAYLSGARQLAKDRRELDTHKLQLDILEQLGRIRSANPPPADEVEVILKRIAVSVGAGLEAAEEASKVPLPEFEKIEDLPVLKRYFIMPRPKTFWSFVITLAYYLYASCVIIYPLVIPSFVAEEGDYEFVAPALVSSIASALLAALLRMWAFSLRRNYERRAAAKLSSAAAASHSGEQPFSAIA